MRYIMRRLGLYLIALWVAITINFFLPRLMPGDPLAAVEAQLGPELSGNPNALNAFRVILGGSNAPLPVQYLQYLNSLAHGNLGISTSLYPTPVSDIIGQTLPWTLFLVGSASILSFVIGSLLGMVVSWRRGGALDTVLPPVTMFLSGFPYFFTAMLLLYVLGVSNHWFPLSHSYDVDTVQMGWNGPFIGDVLKHAVLPVLTIVLTGVGGWLLNMRNVMINTLAEDYVVMAEAKGLTNRRVMMMYAARNALLPNITGFAMNLGFVVGGAILVEIVFSYPGVGYTLLNAVTQLDYPLMQALLLLISIAVLVANFIADLVYVRLDPRVRTS